MSKKQMKSVIGFVMAILFILNMPLQNVMAADKNEELGNIEQMEVVVSEFSNEIPSVSRTVFSGCSIAVAYRTTGMYIEISTGVTQDSPVVGVSNIEVQQRMWYGWKTVAVANGAEAYDTTGITCTMTYTGAQVGETYQVNCVHYADMTYDGVTHYTEAAASTGSFTYTN